MNRRTFNRLIGLGAVGALTRDSPAEQCDAPEMVGGAESISIPKPETTTHIPERTVDWPSQTFRRLLVDTHVPDWDGLLTDFDATAYADTIASAGFQSLMQYANSHVGLCLWRTKLGEMHRGMRGRDYFGEVMEQCRRHGLHRVAYYSLIFDDWAYATHPDWRILPESGYDRQLYSRTGTVCINSPYREHALACLQELVANYDFNGIFLDMTFWPAVCYCPHCTARFWKEENSEPPRLVDWTDKTWRAFQGARERWMREFAMSVTRTIKETRPITVYHQFSTIFLPWQFGVSVEQNDSSDLCGGDFYGGATQFSLVCKAYYGLTHTRPFVFMTSRTMGLGDFETTKPFGQLLLESSVPTIHSAACLLIDAINPLGTLNPHAYEYLSQINAAHDPYEPFLGGDLEADVAVYYDKSSMYDPDVSQVPAVVAAPTFASGGASHRGLQAPDAERIALPHMDAVVGAARILREAHIPFGVLTNATLDQLSRFRAVIVPDVLEMTLEQSERLREFVRGGGVLYASGNSSLQIVGQPTPRFLLEDVLGVRYVGKLGTSTTYLSLSHSKSELTKLIWPQENIGFKGSMVKGEALQGAQVLATATLPFVSPEEGFTINRHFAQIWSNPPSAVAGADAGIVVNSFGMGKAIWVAAPIETSMGVAAENVILHLLKAALPSPYKFEADTDQSVEVTVFHQREKRRLLVGLLNMQEEVPSIPVDATIRVKIPDFAKAKRVLRLPEQNELAFAKSGHYIQFHMSKFEVLAMALVEYE
jgi:hypothetical protein